MNDLQSKESRLNIRASRHQKEVIAKDDAARAFYVRFDFVRSPIDEDHLMLLLKDLRKIVTGSKAG